MGDVGASPYDHGRRIAAEEIMRAPDGWQESGVATNLIAFNAGVAAETFDQHHRAEVKRGVMDEIREQGGRV